MPDGLSAPVLEAIGDAAPVGERVGPNFVRVIELRQRDAWPIQVLMVGDPRRPDAVAQEQRSLEWIGSRLPVPHVVAASPNAAVLKYPVGLPASAPEHRVDPAQSVTQAARALRMVHRTDPGDPTDPESGAPDMRLDVRLAHIEAAVAAGEFADHDFGGPYARYGADRLVEMLRDRQPDEPQLAFGHGRFGLDTVLLDGAASEAKVSGITDWASAGMADPYVDLALAARSVVTVFGAELLPVFFDAYGLEHPDPLRLDYYSLLAEFL